MNTFTNPSLYGVSFPQEFAFTQPGYPLQFPWQQGYQRFMPAIGHPQQGQFGQLGATPYFQQGFWPQYQQNLPYSMKNMGYAWPTFGMAAPFGPMGFPQAQVGSNLPWAWQRPVAIDYSYSY